MILKGLVLYQKDEKYIYLNDLHIYYDNLKNLFEHLVLNEIEFLNFSYIALSSSTLEASLNQVIFDYYLNKFGPIEYKKYFDGIINISFKSKLYILPTIISDSKLKFNNETFIIKKLEELISIRNKQLHRKPYLERIEYDFDSLNEGDPLNVKVSENILSIKKKDCIQINEALLKFKELFLDPYFEGKVEKNELLIEVH
ncbi:hypothetical protein [Chryseobacterium balustinum]|uniref:Uncharacterized protein n=1 Tax=Chryseobacterium balustinum TaxID=246 RepID=A0ABY1LAP8_9FLAO|nr:hypothetical protein [Chryseobacterium balustinum]AZB28299.1 hypothetical protein EB354_02955 [Chryseobacterium balustinum]SKB89664.1 hypothetical protein SAMN05421800_11326 [Chryseobacterium balustinum]